MIKKKILPLWKKKQPDEQFEITGKSWVLCDDICPHTESITGL